MTSHERTATLAVVFDLDGTLVDSKDDIVGAVRFALGEHGKRDRNAAEIASYVGDGARLLLARSLGVSATDERLEPVFATFMAYYAVHAADTTTLMPGAADALSSLSHLPLALCTNKPRAPTDAVLDKLDLGKHFDVVVAGDDLPKNKPHPEPLLHIAAKLGLPPTSLVMVGDGVQDVGAGRAAGAYTVAVLGGFVARESLEAASPDRLIESLHGLPDVIAELRLPAERRSI